MPWEAIYWIARAKSSTYSDMERMDVAVIGGGILGCFAARNLCRWKLSVALLEAREDVCTGISRANTAIVYPGYDHMPGTLKAAMTVRANASFQTLCKELDVPFLQCGSLMLSYGENADRILQKKFRQGVQNQVPGLQMLSEDEARRLEPMLSPGLHTALYAPSAGTVNPWQLGIAACENAVHNGAQLFLNRAVCGIHMEDGGYVLESKSGDLFVRAVINCAGLASASVQEMLFPPSIRITPTAGDYLVLDKASKPFPSCILQYEPDQKGKGLSVVPTVEGSILIGPSERDNETDYATSQTGLSFIRECARRLLPNLDLAEVIRSFAAVRPNPQRADGSSIRSFPIEHPALAFWSLIGIKTPGLTCAQELGAYIAQKVAGELGSEPNSSFDPIRMGIRRPHTLSFEDRKALVTENPDFGEVVCCCEDVTKAEILESVRRGAVTVDGVKRRTGAGMGRCQGSKCQQKITALLAEVLQVDESTVTKDGNDSQITRSGRHETL